MNFLMEIIKPGFICNENTVKRTAQSVTRTTDALPCHPREPPRPADTDRARTEGAAVGDRKGHAVWRPRAPVNVWFSPQPAVTLGAKWPACLLPSPPFSLSPFLYFNKYLLSAHSRNWDGSVSH